MVSVMLVNNETGCVFRLAEIAAILKARKSRALLHTDAVQGFMKVPCDPKTLGVDMMSLSAHKIGGPKGIGALYVGPNVRNIRPLLHGGGQEEGTRSGTEATAQIAGFAKAAELRADGLADKLAHMAEVKAYCKEKLLSIDGVVAVGQGEAPHILMVSLVGYPSDTVYYERHERLAGESHYPLSKMLALAFDGITSLSNKPIRLITGAGIVVSLISFIGVIWAIVQAVLGSAVAGWASTICIVCFMGGVQLVCLGVIGEYVGKIYMETKARPRYIISERTWAPYERKYHG